MPRAETWGFESAQADGTGVLVRLTLFPDDRIAWYWAYLFLPDEGLVVVRDHEVPLPRRTEPDLEIRADSLWAELVCETPGEHWGIGLEAFGLVLDDPWDALRGELGTRIPVGLDLEWENLAPEHVDDARRHQFGRVHGELLVASDRIAFDAVGAREHAGVAQPPPPGHHRATFAIGTDRAADLRLDRAADLRLDGPPHDAGSYVWQLGEPLHRPEQVAVEIRAGDGAGETAVPGPMRYVVDGTLEAEAETAGFAVVPLPEGYALEAVIRVIADASRGAGFAEWVRPRA
jgi:hypothetical protein